MRGYGRRLIVPKSQKGHGRVRMHCGTITAGDEVFRVWLARIPSVRRHYRPCAYGESLSSSNSLALIRLMRETPGAA
jgi:hypothetical protein